MTSDRKGEKRARETKRQTHDDPDPDLDFDPGSRNKMAPWRGVGFLLVVIVTVSLSLTAHLAQWRTIQAVTSTCSSLETKLGEIEERLHRATWVSPGHHSKGKRDVSDVSPSAHLLLSNTANEYKLTWSEFHTYAHNNVLMVDYGGHYVTVETGGTYLVYAQLTFAGKKHRGSGPSCTYQVVLKPYRQRPTEPDVVLLYSATTQMRAGRVLYRGADHRDVFPEDSAYVAGVFPLTAGDRLAVLLPGQSRLCTVPVLGLDASRDRSFFGVVRMGD